MKTSLFLIAAASAQIVTGQYDAFGAPTRGGLRSGRGLEGHVSTKAEKMSMPKSESMKSTKSAKSESAKAEKV